MSDKKIYVDYPKSKKWGVIANILMRTLTILSVFFMIIVSIKEIEQAHHDLILALELIISVLFLSDFLIRAHLSWWKKKFFTNVFNIFDLFASVPFIIAFWFQWYLAVDYLKILRITRVFRIFRLGKYVVFLSNLWKALKKNWYKYKIAGVFFIISLLVAAFLMYVIEGTKNPGFSNIPNSLWRAIVTMGTVWYWDTYPITPLGKFVGSIFILFGPIFVAIISSISIITFLDVMKLINKDKFDKALCKKCNIDWHEEDAIYCRFCGDKLSSTFPSDSTNDYILDKY